MEFELFEDHRQRGIRLGHRGFEGSPFRAEFAFAGLGQHLRCADAGDDVFALGVDEEFAVEVGGAGGGVTGEGHAGC